MRGLLRKQKEARVKADFRMEGKNVETNRIIHSVQALSATSADILLQNAIAFLYEVAV